MIIHFLLVYLMGMTCAQICEDKSLIFIKKRHVLDYRKRDVTIIVYNVDTSF